ncbi:cytochrome C assembly protein [Ktedonosporobacter rubrisoli]|uniref:Heme exporter protein C n=1 Tax=Ktedonosporobacter rubrisoli TaxID=2509675 RepID=A0A4P6K1B0_KTERU|nr:cytochrome c biogenesis protein CcsA [Ktedonosporobacter rubrisoli]QBD81226.1 cytochrome C assembly protein [Ktedonosporobacter rubrisoli]
MALAKRETGVELHSKAPSGQQAAGLPIASLILGGLALIGILIAIFMAFLYAPTDAVQGQSQRIFYFHISVSLVGMLAFGVVTAGGIGYILKRDERWDWLARASAEIGAIFISLGLITGSIWGRTTWGTWWVWDPKLTATLILWFMFVGYLMLRSYMGRTTASAYAGAVLAIVGVFDVPIIYLSVQWWRGMHPQAEVGPKGALPPEVLITMLVALVSFLLLYSFLMIQIYQLQRLQARAQALRASVE